VTVEPLMVLLAELVEVADEEAREETSSLIMSRR
jgi:hypothetical protein